MGFDRVFNFFFFLIDNLITTIENDTATDIQVMVLNKKNILYSKFDITGKMGPFGYN